MTGGEARSGLSSDRASSFPVHPWAPDPGGRLSRWRENVGAPVILDAAGTAPADAQTLVVLTWNVWIGRGRLIELVDAFRRGAFARLGADPAAALIVLVQEAYRADTSIPAAPAGAAARDFSVRFRPEEEIVAVARRLGMYLCYAPSMRNGTDRSDRGNAILSTLPLAGAAGFELPLALQRRVAVAATARLPDGRALRVASAHLDPRGGSARDLLGVAGRAAQARALLTALLAGDDHAPTILGADLNLGTGRREPAFRLLADAGFTLGVPAHAPAWDHTYHRVPRLRLDYLLFRDPAGAIARATVHRLDEHPRDAGPFVFRSDHHPLLARVMLDADTETTP